MSKRRKAAIAVAFAALAVGIAVFLITSLLPRGLSEKEIDDILDSQGWRISDCLNSAGADFVKQIALEAHFDSEGQPYWVGIVDEDFKPLMAKLVNAFNADPSTAGIGLGEVRDCLTKDIVEATRYGNRESDFQQFMRWCGIPADLVYKGDMTDGDGTPHAAGDTVTGGPNNYDFVQNQDASANRNYTYRHDYEASK